MQRTAVTGAAPSPRICRVSRLIAPVFVPALVAVDNLGAAGEVFTFGDARYHGSLGGGGRGPAPVSALVPLSAP